MIARISPLLPLFDQLQQADLNPGQIFLAPGRSDQQFGVKDLSRQSCEAPGARRAAFGIAGLTLPEPAGLRRLAIAYRVFVAGVVLLSGCWQHHGIGRGDRVSRIRIMGTTTDFDGRFIERSSNGPS